MKRVCQATERTCQMIERVCQVTERTCQMIERACQGAKTSCQAMKTACQVTKRSGQRTETSCQLTKTSGQGTGTSCQRMKRWCHGTKTPCQGTAGIIYEVFGQRSKALEKSRLSEIDRKESKSSCDIVSHLYSLRSNRNCQEGLLLLPRQWRPPTARLTHRSANL
jgi:DNA-binding transcriptional regulator YdaS (Cro superfamily)